MRDKKLREPCLQWAVIIRSIVAVQDWARTDRAVPEGQPKPPLGDRI